MTKGILVEPPQSTHKKKTMKTIRLELQKSMPDFSDIIGYSMIWKIENGGSSTVLDLSKMRMVQRLDAWLKENRPDYRTRLGLNNDDPDDELQMDDILWGQ